MVGVVFYLWEKVCVENDNVDFLVEVQAALLVEAEQGLPHELSLGCLEYLSNRVVEAAEDFFLDFPNPDVRLSQKVLILLREELVLLLAEDLYHFDPEDRELWLGTKVGFAQDVAVCLRMRVFLQAIKFSVEIVGEVAEEFLNDGVGGNRGRDLLTHGGGLVHQDCDEEELLEEICEEKEVHLFIVFLEVQVEVTLYVLQVFVHVGKNGRNERLFVELEQLVLTDQEIVQGLPANFREGRLLLEKLVFGKVPHIQMQKLFEVFFKLNGQFAEHLQIGEVFVDFVQTLDFLAFGTKSVVYLLRSRFDVLDGGSQFVQTLLRFFQLFPHFLHHFNRRDELGVVFEHQALHVVVQKLDLGLDFEVGLHQFVERLVFEEFLEDLGGIKIFSVYIFHYKRVEKIKGKR